MWTTLGNPDLDFVQKDEHQHPSHDKHDNHVEANSASAAMDRINAAGSAANSEARVAPKMPAKSWAS